MTWVVGTHGRVFVDSEGRPQDPPPAYAAVTRFEVRWPGPAVDILCCGCWLGERYLPPEVVEAEDAESLNTIAKEAVE